MKAIFAHDHRFIPIENQVYSEAQFESSLWPRYLAHFDEIVVSARKGPIPLGKTPSQLELSSYSNVQFEFLPDLSSPAALLSGGSVALPKMRELVANADVVIARLPSELGLLAIKCAQEHAKPWAVEVVGCPWDGLLNHGSWRGKLYAPFARNRMRSAVAAAPFALYVTEEFLQTRYPNIGGTTTSVSNVILPKVSETILERRINRIITLGSKPIRIGLIGSLHTKVKGIQTVLAAMAAIREKLPPFSFHVLGNGDTEQWRLDAATLGVADITFFEGTLPAGNPVLRWLDAIDLYLQPSLKEGLPRALIEAMSRGCPAIASTVAGIPELLRAEDLIRPGNVRDLSSLLLSCSGDVNWMKARAKFNWEVARRYEAEKLNRRRHEFWSAFVESAKK